MRTVLVTCVLLCTTISVTTSVKCYDGKEIEKKKEVVGCDVKLRFAPKTFCLFYYNLERDNHYNKDTVLEVDYGCATEEVCQQQKGRAVVNHRATLKRWIEAGTRKRTDVDDKLTADSQCCDTDLCNTQQVPTTTKSPPIRLQDPTLAPGYTKGSPSGSTKGSAPTSTMGSSSASTSTAESSSTSSSESSLDSTTPSDSTPAYKEEANSSYKMSPFSLLSAAVFIPFFH